MRLHRIGPWPSLAPGAWMRPRAESLPYPLGRPDCWICALARHGLWHGVRALGLVPGDEVLVPAYHHGSEVEALRRAGLRVVFYGGGDDLEPEPGELDRLATPRTRALHLIHHLGFPQDAARWRSFCDERGWLLLEDAAQAWLADRDGTPVGSHGDLAIFSLYKVFGLPDGAVLRSEAAPDPPAATARRGVGEAAALHGRWLAQRLSVGRPGDRRDYDQIADFDLGDAGSRPAWTSSALLARVVDPSAAAARRAHHRALLGVAGEHVPAPFARVPPGASPWVLPVEVPDKRAARARLGALGVGTLDLWSVPHPLLDPSDFPAIAHRRARTIGVPVHQEMRPSDLERVAAGLQSVIAGARRRTALVMEVVESDAAVADAWEELTHDVFGSLPWYRAWSGSEGAGHRAVLAVAKSPAGATVGIVPLVARRERGLRVLRIAGHGPADRGAPICRAGDRAAVAGALRRFLRGDSAAGAEGGADLFVGDLMPADEGWAALLGARRLERESTPVLWLGDRDWEGFLASRSQNFRQQVRRRERRLLGDGEVAYRLCDDPARLPADLETLFDLHARRWADGHSTAFTPERRRLHRAFAPEALRRGWLRLWMLERSGKALAAWYGFRLAGAEVFYQSGRDPAAADANAGSVLLAHTIRSAMEDGMREYRFGRGDEPYKSRFADRDPGLETVALPLGPRGRAALAARAVRHRRH